MRRLHRGKRGGLCGFRRSVFLGRTFGAGYLFYSQGSAVVYYDIQFEELIGEWEQHERTGMFTMQHQPIVVKNQVFLPIPQNFEREMVPTDRTIKFTIRHQILGVGSDSSWE
jgi:hypothetical protein